MFPEVVYGGRLPAMCCVYRLWVCSLFNKAQLNICLDIMKPKRCCTSIVSTVPLLIGIEEKMWLISQLRRSWAYTSRGSPKHQITPDAVK